MKVPVEAQFVFVIVFGTTETTVPCPESLNVKWSLTLILVFEHQQVDIYVPTCIDFLPWDWLIRYWLSYLILYS